MIKIISTPLKKPTKWSGGLTTELFIYPEGSSYTERNFDFRLSTATVEVETSVFTPLQYVQRTLMVLEGKMELNHQGHHSAVLGPMDVDDFDGGWETSSKGTCVDFNLMCLNGTKGTVEGFDLDMAETVNMDCNDSHCFVYIFKGALNVNYSSIEEGSLIHLTHNSSTQLRAVKKSRLVIIKIR
ncbi:MAG: HutD family protein [Crocinitomicaceae bacterium]